MEEALILIEKRREYDKNKKTKKKKSKKMKIIKIIISALFISLFSLTFSYAEDCSKYDKLSKEYAKCTSDKLKKETSQKADEIKSKTAKKIEEGKKKLIILI